MKSNYHMIVKLIVSIFIWIGVVNINSVYVYGDESLNQQNINDEQTVSVSNGYTQEIVNYAHNFIGRPYVFGATGPNSFDCSGFTSYVYKHFGMNIPRTSGEQFNVGKPIQKSELKNGDLIFFNTYTKIGHVGIYIGNGDFIHAASSGSVKVNSLNEGYYTTNYAGARRVV
ncbi:C40 family peptidase [Clostridium sp. SHJSY1]|uniref:C40 family peptidase n=1 Tax=Clostridium sp. SHJSY1 TaxID=2942483 RepID=UPI002876E808|nr:C40 family peptidase [Clostridium sp. SHJSY1]MDS0528008.1 C40 family peptidase [Clostridium sp. SHJSY1]